MQVSTSLMMTLLIRTALSLMLCGICFPQNVRSTQDPHYGDLPPVFEKNDGQTASQVKFLSRARGYTLFVTEESLVAAITGANESGAAVHVRLAGVQQRPIVEGEQRLESVSNYLVGGPRTWKIGVPHFARVRMRHPYRGIDLLVHTKRSGLEVDFVLEPGARPEQIRLTVDGASMLTINEKGDLVIHATAGDLLAQKPLAYQRVAKKQIRVPAKFVLTSSNEVAFSVGKYDRSRTLVIDPVLSYSTYLGGSGDDWVSDIAVDGNGYAYVSGGTRSVDFPTTSGALKRTPAGAFVAKFNKSGSGLVFSTYLYGSASAIATDTSNNIYVGGYASWTGTVPESPGKLIGNTAAGEGFFVAKLNSTGSAILYRLYIGAAGSWFAGIAGISVDSSGHAYIAGTTWDHLFPTTPGAFETTSHALGGDTCECDGFITKINPAGDGLSYSTFLSGTVEQFISDLAIDASGNAFVTGSTESETDFPTTAGSYQPTTSQEYTAFVSKLNSSGSELVYSTFLHGASNQDMSFGSAVALDSSANAYISGSASPGFPTTPGAYVTTVQPPANTPYLIFVTRLNDTGSALVYSSLIGAGHSSGIAVTGTNKAVVAGTAYFPGAIPTTRNAFQQAWPSSGSTTFVAFVSKLSSTGGLSYSSLLGGASVADTSQDVYRRTYAGRVAVDSGGAAYLAGSTNTTDFPTTRRAFDKSTNGGYDGYVAKVIEPSCPSTTVNPSVRLCAPAANATVNSPVRVTAMTNSSTPVRTIRVYLDGSKIYQAKLGAFTEAFTMSPGTHRLTVQATDVAGFSFKKTVYILVP
ncbi:MAG: SBBP repeat-containing protein [Acidobacteriaceae bacterium]